MADLVGFKSDGVWVALSTGRSFAPATLWSTTYSAGSGGWSSYDLYPRALGDVDGSGRAAIVGFGGRKTYVTRYDHQARFYYDADGNRVVSINDGARAVYIGDWVETGASYYHLGGQRVAKRTTGGVTYLHGDHLGSTSKTTGAASSAQLYEAYGAKRGASEVDTPYRYTGQRWEENDALDIYYYKARWYDPALGRFLQPDTIVPSANDPQSLNRYCYASNNPVRYNDPTGHYGPDVHRDLTQKLAHDVAFVALVGQYALATDQADRVASDLAMQIAKGDMAPDSPYAFFLSRDSSALPIGDNLHFLTHKEALNLMEKTLSANADEPATPAEFGRALHAVQDSYRHRAFGYTGSFAVWGIEQYDEGLRMYGGILDEEGMRNAAQWGHIGTTIAALWRKKILKETGVTSPDDPLKESHWPDLDAAMTAETQRLLEDYLREYIAWYLQQQTQSEQNSEPYE